MDKAITLTYMFSRGMTKHEDLSNECSDKTVPSTETITHWISYCREACFNWSMEQNQGKIGGEGIAVEINECKVGRRKYNVGRLLSRTWIFGMVEIIEGNERRDGRFRLVKCPDNRRDAATLIQIIQDNIEAGTTIVSDC